MTVTSCLFWESQGEFKITSDLQMFDMNVLLSLYNPVLTFSVIQPGLNKKKKNPPPANRNVKNILACQRAVSLPWSVAAVKL